MTTLRPLQRIQRLLEVDSTNTVALAWSGELAAGELPALVLAERQTAGRGRGAHRWWAGEGALTCSLLIEPAAFGVPKSLWPALSLTVGAALATAVQPFAPHCDVRLKWPNDVFADGRKLAGILIEVPPATPDRLVIGWGMNVNNRLAQAPPEVRARAASLSELTGADCDRDALLHALLEQLFADLVALGGRDHDLRGRWRRLCLLTGRSLVIEDHGRTTAGTCLGIDDDGALRVQTAWGIERLFSGTVVEYV